MISCSVYSRATGEILYQLSGSLVGLLADMDFAANNLIDGNWPGDRYYVKDAQVASRPVLTLPEAQIVADGTVRFVVELPEGSAGSIMYLRDGAGELVPADHPDRFPLSGDIEGDVLEWGTVHPGLYRVILVPAFPFQRAQLDVLAVAP